MWWILLIAACSGRGTRLPDSDVAQAQPDPAVQRVSEIQPACTSSTPARAAFLAVDAVACGAAVKGR